MPIIVLSAREPKRDKVAALDAGADDYVTKPFGMDELLARLRAALRRARAGRGGARRRDRRLHASTSRPSACDRDGEEIRLTPTEWHLVEVLVRNPGKLVAQRQLLQEVWGPQYARRDELPARLHGPDPPQARARAVAARATSSPSPAWATASRSRWYSDREVAPGHDDRDLGVLDHTLGNVSLDRAGDVTVPAFHDVERYRDAEAGPALHERIGLVEIGSGSGTGAHIGCAEARGVPERMGGRAVESVDQDERGVESTGRQPHDRSSLLVALERMDAVGMIADERHLHVLVGEQRPRETGARPPG